MLASIAEQTSLCLTWWETPEDMFCRVVAHVDPDQTAQVAELSLF